MPNKEKKKTNVFIAILLILVIILGAPLAALTFTYFISEEFQYLTNEFMSEFPLGVGRYFANLPTREEKEKIKLQIAKHYVLMDIDRIVDKLTIIRKEDQQLFNDLLVIMNGMNSRKMQEVNEILRSRVLEGNILQRTLKEIHNEEIAYVDEIIKHITSLPISAAVAEIEKMVVGGKLTNEQLDLFFRTLDSQVAAKYLIYLDDKTTFNIMRNLPSTNRNEFEKIIASIDKKYKNLQEIADIYAKGSISEAVNDLTNIEKYNINELAVIFLQMGVKDAAEILVHAADNEFILSLVEAINEREILNSLRDEESKSFSKSLVPAIDAFRNFEIRLNELSQIYEEMEVAEVADLMSRMLRRNQIFKQVELPNGERVSFTEEQLVIDILNNFKHNLIASILGELDTREAVELSQKLIIKP
ncbi:MAG: hypothetical protein LR001_03040 [Clostridiales bacterium]|nr:hypothetical protein [Clostridiales bacterium]